MASAVVACGFQVKDLAFIYFDAHDDLDSPDSLENGYFDAMGLSILRGESWERLMGIVPGFEPFDYRRFLYGGQRDQSDIQRQCVNDAGIRAIVGSPEEKVDFAAELGTELKQKSYSPALVHLDFDVLDDSYGKVNDYPSPGGLFECELVTCMDMIPSRATPKSLTVCSFDPAVVDGDKIARIVIRAIKTSMQSLLATDVLCTRSVG